MCAPVGNRAFNCGINTKAIIIGIYIFEREIQNSEKQNYVCFIADKFFSLVSVPFSYWMEEFVYRSKWIVTLLSLPFSCGTDG